MKRLVFITSVLKLFFITGIAAGNTGNANVMYNGGESNVTVIYMTNETFKKLVFDYEKSKEWKYVGSKPAIIDFYATWCPPCRQLSPIVEEIAKEYSGKIIVYKVDTDKEPLLSQSLGISNLPTLLFIPMKGKPQATMGFLPKETLVKAISEVLLINK
jgi:thioredoxin 1